MIWIAVVEIGRQPVAELASHSLGRRGGRLLPCIGQRPGQAAPGASEFAARAREAAAHPADVPDRAEPTAERAVGAPAVLLGALGDWLLVRHRGPILRAPDGLARPRAGCVLPRSRRCGRG